MPEEFRRSGLPVGEAGQCGGPAHESLGGGQFKRRARIRVCNEKNPTVNLAAGVCNFRDKNAK